jgi:hypothetical protein
VTGDTLFHSLFPIQKLTTMAGGEVISSDAY